MSLVLASSFAIRAAAGKLFDKRYDRGEDYYLRLYAHCPRDRVSCDVSPDYLDSLEAPARVSRIAPRIGRPIRFVVLLREPVARLYSSYVMGVRKGSREPLEEQLVKYRQRLIEKSLYYKHLRRWADFFPPESFLYLLTDQLGGKLLDEIAQFVGVRGPIDNAYVRMKLNAGGLQRWPVVDASFRFAGTVLRRANAMGVLQRLHANPILAALRNLNRKPCRRTPADDRILSDLKRYFADDVRALSKHIDRPDLLAIWGYAGRQP